MIKKLRVAVDHGNRNMKTCHFIFTTGLTEQDKKRFIRCGMKNGS